jgi:hypothetical protein
MWKGKKQPTKEEECQSIKTIRERQSVRARRVSERSATKRVEIEIGTSYFQPLSFQDAGAGGVSTQEEAAYAKGN